MSPSTFALIVLGLVSVVHQAAACDFSGATCADGLMPVGDGNGCDYYCKSPPRPWCPGATLKNGYICGGTSALTAETGCPTVSCAATWSYALSGPGGCAKARTAVSAVAISDTKEAYKQSIVNAVQEFCSAPAFPQLAVTESVTTIATAISIAFANYDIYVCSCCPGGLNSAAGAQIKATATAVASAYSESYTEALAELNCNGKLVGSTLPGVYAAATSGAVASTIELAIVNLYKEAQAKGGACTAYSRSTFKSAVATAIACSFAEAYAAVAPAFSIADGPTSYSCGATAALAGSDAYPGATCPSLIGDHLYQCPNLGRKML